MLDGLAVDIVKKVKQNVIHFLAIAKAVARPFTYQAIA